MANKGRGRGRGRGQAGKGGNGDNAGHGLDAADADFWEGGSDDDDDEVGAPPEHQPGQAHYSYQFPNGLVCPSCRR